MTTVTIHGQIKQNPRDTSGYIGGLGVFITIGDRIRGQSTTDDKGRFTLTVHEMTRERVNLFCCGIGMDTLLLYSATNFIDSDKPRVFYIPVRIRKNLLGKVYCPMCHRTDKVYKVVYSDNPAYVIRTAQNGDTIYSPIYRGIYHAGTCINAVARYFCDRDKVKF